MIYYNLNNTVSRRYNTILNTKEGDVLHKTYKCINYISSDWRLMNALFINLQRFIRYLDPVTMQCIYVNILRPYMHNQ